MDVFLNPGLIHILEKIYFYLDFESLDNCALLNKSFAIMLTDPRFWYKKCLQRRQNYVQIWNRLFESIDENEAAKLEFVQVLKIMYFGKKQEQLANNEFGKFNMFRNHLATIPIMCQKFEFAEFVFEKLYPQKDLKSTVSDLFWMTKVLKTEEFKLIEHVLKKYKDVNIIPGDYMERPRVILKILENNIELIELFTDYLITKTKNPLQSYSIREYSIDHAARNGYINILKVLAPTVDEVNFQDIHGMTPIEHAFKSGHMEVVDFLATECQKFDETPIIDDILPILHSMLPIFNYFKTFFQKN